MFEKSLQDLVKGIRANKRDPSAFISGSIAECKQELRNVDPYIKALAVRKLTYLQMLGYDVSWASFAIVETMSQARFAHKRIGYLAACQCFSESTDVVLLTTNLLKKEFQSASQYEVGLAVNCLANIVTPDLARDLLGDTVQLMSHTKPYVRKKAVSAMFKLFMQYPHGLRLTFDRFKERLSDTEAAVTSCAVNVICELSKKNPNNYLAMAPQFFRLLTTSSNNWMLIKVVKLMGTLVPHEPRLARKLLEPLATIIQNTAAKSLQYECIHTLTLALPFTKKQDGADSRAVPGIVKLCTEHLQLFIEDDDQNLKYLGLVGFVELMKSHPKAVVEHKELVLLCLSDDDVTIRTRALELLTGMVTRRNLEDLVSKLLSHVDGADGGYRDELMSKIIFMCSREKYSYLSDFGWYLGVLDHLAHIRGSKHASLVAEQLVDVTMRVRPVRQLAFRDMVTLLLDERLAVGQGVESVADVLAAAAWIAGEYVSVHTEPTDDDDHSSDEEEEDEDDEDEDVKLKKPKFPKTRLHERLVDVLTQPSVSTLPPRVQAVYLHNTLKVVALACTPAVDDDELQAVLTLLAKRGDTFLRSEHMEVQERAASLIGLLKAYGVLPAVDLQKARECVGALRALSAEKMVPVNPKAQSKVPLPEGFDLHDRVAPTKFAAFLEEQGGQMSADALSQMSAEEAERRSWAACQFVDSPNNSFILDEDDEEMPETQNDAFDDDGGSEQAPTEQRQSNGKHNASDPFYLAAASGEEEPQEKKKKKKKTASSKERRRKVKKMDVDTSELMPDGALNSDDESKIKKKKKSKKSSMDATNLDQVDITTPLRDDEVMPKTEHRVVVNKPPPTVVPEEKKLKEKKKKKKKEAETVVKKKKTKKEVPEKKKKVQQTAAVLDLLDLGGGAPSPPPASSSNDLLDFFGGDPAPSTSAAPPSAAPAPSTKKKKSVGWAPLFSHETGIKADYRFSSTSIEVRLSNTSETTFTSVSMLLGTSTTKLAQSLSPAASAVSTVMLPQADGYKVEGTASFYSEGLVPELHRAPLFVSLPVSAFLAEPTQTSPEAFADLLGSKTWHSASARATISTASADPIAAVARALRAFVVERQENSASMAASTTGGQHHLALLVKLKDKKIKLDIKSTDAALATAISDLFPLLDFTQ